MSQTPQLVLQGTDWGNPLTYFNGNNWTLTWKNGRQLATATKTGTSVSYGYDLNGLRTSKKVGGVTHTYLYAGGQLQRETYISGRITRKLDFLYDQNGRPYALNDTNGTTTSLYYYVLNLQGDVIQLVGTDGNIAASYRYDPWGRVISATGSMANINPLRYRGYYYDTETGWYYLQSRYYDPTVCRFINADFAEYSAISAASLTGTNLFAYCQNNPISYGDNNGEWLNILIGAVVGAVVNVAAAIVGQKPIDEVIVSGICGAVGGGLTAAGFGTIAGAVTGFVDSAYGNIKDVANGKKSVGEAIVGTTIDTALGAAFGAMGSGSSTEIKKSMQISRAGWNGVKTLLTTTIHPTVKQSAKKALRTAVKYAGKAVLSEAVSNIVSTGITKGSSWVAGKVYRYYAATFS